MQKKEDSPFTKRWDSLVLNHRCMMRKHKGYNSIIMYPTCKRYQHMHITDKIRKWEKMQEENLGVFMKYISVPCKLLSNRGCGCSRCSTSTHGIVNVQQLLKRRLNLNLHGLPWSWRPGVNIPWETNTHTFQLEHNVIRYTTNKAVQLTRNRVKYIRKIYIRSHHSH